VTGTRPRDDDTGSRETDPILSVRDLRTYFDAPETTLRAVAGVSFDVFPGETVALVGESGCGKTVTCESLTRIDSPPARIVGGEIRYDGEDLTRASDRRLREVRGDGIAHVFQNPQGALDPVYTVGEQIVEAVRAHGGVPRGEARDRAVDLLDRVGIPNASNRAGEYPHEFSGGMRQRAAIAVALAGDPDLLVADEPTTALDVTTQASVLGLFRDLQAERDMAVVFVTHDIGVVSEIADRVVVMYAGKVMERGPVETVLVDPAHPYTRALLDCLPGRAAATEGIGGEVPDPADPPSGCRFHPRCPHAIEVCTGGEQPELHGADDSRAACVFYRPGYDASRVRSSSAGPVEGNGGTEDGGRIGEGGDE
jgi:peptide/nickel transport system ATP-binding protein